MRNGLYNEDLSIPTALVTSLKNELIALELNHSEIYKIVEQLTDIFLALDRSLIIAITDEKGVIKSANDTFCRISKYSREELIGQNHGILKSGFHSQIFYKEMWGKIKQGIVWEGEIKNRAKDGSYYWVKTVIIPLKNEADKSYKYISIRTDISEGKFYEDQVRELLKNDFIQVMQSLDNFVFRLKKLPNEQIVFSLIAGKLAKKLGFNEVEHLYKPAEEIFPNVVFNKLIKPVEATFSGVPEKIELEIKKRHLFVNLSPFYRNGVIEEIVGTVSDITDLKKSKSAIQHMAYHDILTDLPNRRMLDKNLTELVIEAQADEFQFAVLLIDLDRFKNINDTLGHQAGDEILKLASQRIQIAATESDVKKAALYHLGGDDFVIILRNVTNETVKGVCQTIRNFFETPFFYKEAEIVLKMSIGICFYPADGENAEELLKNTDTAMFTAKEQGRNQYLRYNAEMNRLLQRKLYLENDLRKALTTNGQLMLFYQPQLNAKTEKIVGVEALIRWHHPKEGLIPPLEFIQIAEESGLIISLGDWVVKEACKQLKQWQNQGYLNLRMSVNIATKQFQHSSFVANLANVLAAVQLAPETIELEITESSLLDSTKMTLDTLARLNKLGIKIAIDDFGTGYSSLAYLRKFPISTLKIDQTFIYELPEHEGDKAIVSSIINLAHNLGLRVVAEGVETKEALAYLQKENCDELQGYYFSRPLPAIDLATILETHCKKIKINEKST